MAGGDCEVERYKCRFVAEGCSEVPGLSNNFICWPTPTAACNIMVLAEMIVADLELHCVGVWNKHSYALQMKRRYVSNSCRTIISEEGVGESDRALAQASRNWNSPLVKGKEGLGFELSMVDPCVQRQNANELEIIVVVHVDIILVDSKGIWKR